MEKAVEFVNKVLEIREKYRIKKYNTSTLPTSRTLSEILPNFMKIVEETYNLRENYNFNEEQENYIKHALCEEDDID